MNKNKHRLKEKFLIEKMIKYKLKEFLRENMKKKL